MAFEFTLRHDLDFLERFPETFEISVLNNHVTLPATLRKGIITKTDPGSDFKFVMHHYMLKQDFHLKRQALDSSYPTLN